MPREQFFNYYSLDLEAPVRIRMEASRWFLGSRALRVER